MKVRARKETFTHPRQERALPHPGSVTKTVYGTRVHSVVEWIKAERYLTMKTGQELNRRRLLQNISSTIVGALIIPASGILLPSQIREAEAGKGWCRMDPWFLVDGQSVFIMGWAKTSFDHLIQPAEFHFTYPAGHYVEVDPAYPYPDCPTYTYEGPQFGCRFVFFPDSPSIKVGRMQVVAYGDGPVISRDYVFKDTKGTPETFYNVITGEGTNYWYDWSEDTA